MITTPELTIERTSEGAWRISAVVNGYLETRRYYDYTQAEAIQLFKSEFN